MAIYYFNVREPSERIRDDEGTDLPNLDAACSYAIHCARDLMRETLRYGELSLGNAIEITDASGGISATVEFADAVTLL